jgi:phosphoenolpyruvate carboxykinase (ATP)
MTITIPTLENMTIEAFIDTFHKIMEWKKANGWNAYHDNPSLETMQKQASFYGEEYANGSWGWSSNIWSRSAPSTAVIEDNSQLHEQHKLLMRSALEYVLAPNPLIKVDGTYGEHPSVAMHCRLWNDARYPDLPMRWRELVFDADKDAKPDMEALMLPGLWAPATMPGTDGRTPMFVIRFPEHWFSLVTVSSYQGEWKKMALTHWIYHVYLNGGTGQHAASKQFEIQDINGKWKRKGLAVWGLTGSGKSAHGMYMFDKTNAELFKHTGIDFLEIIREQYIKNDDIVGLFLDGVRGSEKGSWTKTEDVGPSQYGIYTAGMNPRAMHENTGKGPDGNPNFLDEVLRYHGLPNRNARSVMYLKDMAPYFDGSIDIDFPPNMGVFISPGYLTDFAWLKIADPNFAAATLAAGRTVGHPAQSTKGIGMEKYVALYSPFIVGKKARQSDHTHRFLEFKTKRDERLAATGEDTLETYLINTTGKVGTQYEGKGESAKPIFEMKKGRRNAVGGTGPSIEETEVFLMQAARDAITYEPHPIWGERVMCPVDVPGISKERLAELNPFSYRKEDEMRALLGAQVERTKNVFDTQVNGLEKEIYNAMDF